MSDVAIDKIAFGKQLRPSTVDSLNKINEIIDAVNGMTSTDYQGEIDAINSKLGTLTTRVDTATSDITQIKSTNESQQSDIDDIKVTLYTPLEQDESTQGDQ